MTINAIDKLRFIFLPVSYTLPILPPIKDPTLTSRKYFIQTNQRIKALNMESNIEYVNYNEYNQDGQGNTGPELQVTDTQSKEIHTNKKRVRRKKREDICLPSGEANESDGSAKVHQSTDSSQTNKTNNSPKTKKEKRNGWMWKISKWCLILSCIIVVQVLIGGLIYGIQSLFNSNETGIRIVFQFHKCTINYVFKLLSLFIFIDSFVVFKILYL